VAGGELVLAGVEEQLGQPSDGNTVDRAHPGSRCWRARRRSRACRSDRSRRRRSGRSQDRRGSGTSRARRSRRRGTRVPAVRLRDLRSSRGRLRA
jgi:hypothetical protein